MADVRAAGTAVCWQGSCDGARPSGLRLNKLFTSWWMTHNTQLSGCSSRICTSSPVVGLLLFFFPSTLFSANKLLVKSGLQLACVGILFFFRLHVFLVGITFCTLMLFFFFFCFCFWLVFIFISCLAKLIRLHQVNTFFSNWNLTWVTTLFSQLRNLWSNPTFAGTTHKFVDISVNEFSPVNSFLFMGCGGKAGAIFDRMFGTLAGGSQRTDGVLILSVAFLPPSLRHSTHRSVLTCSHVVVLLFLQKKNPTPMRPFPTHRPWMKHALALKTLVTWCWLVYTQLSVTLDVFISLPDQINNHLSPFDLRKYRAFNSLSDKPAPSCCIIWPTFWG